MNFTCTETPHNDSWCPEVFDNFLCWPATPPGQNVSLPCPERINGVIIGAKAYRRCLEDGRWETRGDEKDKDKGYTNYNNCLLPQLLDLLKMCDEIKECAQITRTTRTIEMVGLSFSLISLIVSLIIFFQYRVLKNNRTKIHKNLFIATLLQVVFRLIKYVDQELKAGDRIIENTPILDEACITLLEYSKTAMFTWMFIEGLYLHNVITVTVFQEYSYIKIYFYVGWTAPAVITAVWVWTMKMVRSNWGFYYFLPYYWILEGPRSTIIVVNLLFLINIIRVLIVKLRESHTSEIEQVRKAVRAAIFLLPLMGIANILFWMGYRFTQGWKLALWSYTSYFLNTFQGFFVAILYCFLNGEVQTAVKNSFYLHMSLRNHDYTPCRNLTLISTAPDPEQHIEKESTNWIRYCLKQNKKSPEEKEISVCDLNDRRNSAIVTALTMVETKPLTRESVNTLPKLSDETDTTIIEDKSSETKV
ncbi:PDF receptor isoform X2 [Tribolium castaneum]|uniref:PDF receptor isoform X2 n=1 Tax=Tribolium castaneum TaxID=7070 RepID=UPI00046BEE3F|nr:PREDICTED: PDF receptor isoform X1 [Tribolium castaneum]XP_015835552.1 PREDICTED: PDF receptor isoform X1 [Tribolium castaneum]XP_015835553.1 PREDICTED: PDF receptor isoform X1 [Tribolium castaneum]|eukprot:XP_008193265.1 PREDICTED: PDF receptor isoform X1 [Tribolium castaneum]